MENPTSRDLPDSLTSNLAYVESLYAEYLRNPQNLSADWQQYFAALKSDNGAGVQAPLGPSFKAPGLFSASPGTNGNGSAVKRDAEVAALQDRVDQMIRNFRERGHMAAHLDPLGIPRRELPELDPAYYGFDAADMERSFSTFTINGPDVLKLKDIVQRMRNTYCRSIGAQFMHIDDFRMREWLQQRMEGTENRVSLTRDEQVRILTGLTDAAMFEQFTQKKYIGSKTFSLEGAESLIPLLWIAIEKAGNQGVREVVLAMAHRGRLNVLANVMGKTPQQIFREFEDIDPEMSLGRGDVKYHLGYSNDWKTAAGQNVHLTLCFNPSHLEFINPVAMGRMRAKQDRAGDTARANGLVVLIHGDAAFIGEGVAQETLNLGGLQGYTTGGALHIIVNNQIGFTTSPQEGRSCMYASDVAKMMKIPIFHVNGEDPEAVAQVVRLALDFRREFKRDVMIDMYGYRRHGHNEGDEPAFTQPMLYKTIRQRKTVREGYLEHLLALNEITRAEADRLAEQRKENLEKELTVARSNEYVHRAQTLTGIWDGYHGGPDHSVAEVPTQLDEAALKSYLEAQTRLPADFKPHPKIEKFIEGRVHMVRGEKPLDWSAGEAIAFASLLAEGRRIRMSGQDCERGTFSHRHMVLHDVETGRRFLPLQNLNAAKQGPLEIINSPLSEVGVMGFEYGYSLDTPDGLVIWEAQFGDFFNVAQVIIDQFIASAEDKWKRLSGVVLLLPHGFEGQGPEHSSARLERFLTMAAQDNIQIVNLTTPAQFFHCLRRQVLRSWRKPLVVMSPKSLLRNPKVVSEWKEFSQGGFQRIIPDDLNVDPKSIKRVLLCSGKIYYDLIQERETQGRKDVAIIRVEQLYPLLAEALTEKLLPYAAGTPVFWVQEEPENMGAWRYMLVKFGQMLGGKYPFQGISRPASASPATGSANSHKLEQKQILTKAFAN